MLLFLLAVIAAVLLFGRETTLLVLGWGALLSFCVFVVIILGATL
jgi:hypothetical protein